MARVNRITLGEIATATGFSKTTVSLSLRNHPKIAAPTRELIRNRADQMGYRPNPLVSANMAQIRLRNGSPTHGTLGILTWGNLRRGQATRQSRLPEILEGIQHQADEEGFQINLLDLAEAGMTPQRLEQICETRAIHGLIVLLGESGPGVQARLPLDWSQFAMVNAGIPAAETRAPAVGFDVMHVIGEGYRTLREAGFEEIGMILDPETNRWYQNLPAAAFLQAQMDAGVAAPRMACTLVEQQSEWEPWQAGTQALLLCDPSDPQRSILETMFPPEARLDLIQSVGTGEAYLSDGYTFPGRQIGQAAVDVVTRALYHNERGFPEFPHRIQIPPAPLVRQKRQPSAKKHLAYA